jgi:hypothetical protein
MESKLSGVKQVTLIISGSFCPIHNQHIRALKVVKRAIPTSVEVKGMIMPVHGDALR